MVVVLLLLLAQPSEQKLASVHSISNAKDAERGTFCGAQDRANLPKYQNRTFQVAITG